MVSYDRIRRAAKIGVTGHQDLGPLEQVAWVRSVIREVLSILRPCMGYTCLAAGADQIFAECLIAQGIPYVAIIPSRQYEQSFVAHEHRDNYFKLLNLADSSINLDFPSPGDEAYVAAGQSLLQFVDLIVAIWNGRPARGPGGTGDVVQMARSRKTSVLHIDPWLRSVQWSA